MSEELTFGIRGSVYIQMPIFRKPSCRDTNHKSYYSCQHLAFEMTDNIVFPGSLEKSGASCAASVARDVITAPAFSACLSTTVSVLSDWLPALLNKSNFC